jgi:hypothetical protein
MISVENKGVINKKFEKSVDTVYIINSKGGEYEKNGDYAQSYCSRILQHILCTG